MCLSFLKATSKDVFICICICACSSPPSAVMYVCEDVLFKHKPIREVPLGNYIAFLNAHSLPSLFYSLFRLEIQNFTNFRALRALEPCSFLELLP